MKKCFFFITCLLISVFVQGQNIAKNYAPAGTIIIPASSFLDQMPKNNVIAEASSLRVPWIFNNTALTLASLTNMITKISVPESGTYYVYARSMGTVNSSFKVAVGDKVTSEIFGNGALSWKKGGSFELKAGIYDVKLTRINPSPSVDVVVLSRNAELKEEDIKSFQLDKDVQLLKEYRIPSSNAVKFGEVDGDNKTDFMVMAPDFSAYVYNNEGKELWSWKAPQEYVRERSEFEAPGVLWDFDQDGKAEVAHWRFLDGKEWLVIADGLTGNIKNKVEWPTKALPHVYNNFRLAIAKLTPNAPNEIAVFTDMGETININAYTSDLKLLWQHTETRKKDNLGHYIYPVDLNKDGVDEVLIGSLLLDSKGKEIWNRFELLGDNHDHADSYRFGDVDHDGKLDLVTANSETGVFVYKAMTGEIIWQNTAEHSQQIQVGDFLKGVPGPQVAVGGRTYGNRTVGEPYLASRVYWFDNKGNLLSKFPQEYPLNGNPDFVLGNWRGNGKNELFWFKFRMNDLGKGELYFPDPVFHMFDFMGTGAEQVITLNQGVLRVYGSKTAVAPKKDLKLDKMYLKNKVVNHTHY